MKQKKITWRLLLLPFALIYSFIAYVRNKLYDFGILASRKGVLPTVVIGNLTVGGTGKTPMTVMTARLLAQQYNVAVLSRGYKRKSKQCLIIDRNTSYRMAGDEPKLIANKTGLPVAVCADRLQGIEMIKQKLPETDVVVLDDAFQHRRLKGNVNILLIDYTRPVFYDYFLPAGNLRDNRYRLRQADIIVFTKCPEGLSAEEAELLTRKINRTKEDVFFTAIAYQDLVNYYTGEMIKLVDLVDYDVVTISGLARNDVFVDFLRSRTRVVGVYSFPDHKEYKFAQLRKIFYNFAQLYTKDKLLVTTDKDFVKISEFDLDQATRSKLFVLPVDVKFLFNSQEIFKHKILSQWKKA